MTRILGYYTYKEGAEESIGQRLDLLNEDNSDTVDGPVKLDLGESVPGLQQLFKITVRNEHPDGYYIELRNPVTTDKDLKIVGYPPVLSYGKTGVVEFVYTPAKDRITPLNAKWGFDVVVG